MKVDAARRAALLAASQRKLGLRGYARVLASLRDAPQSTADLVQRHGVHQCLMLRITRHLLRTGFIHRSSWYRPAPNSRMVPVWAFGAEGDVSMPQYEVRPRRPRPAPSILILLTTVLDLVRECPMSNAELAAELKMHIESVYRIVGVLRDFKLVHVASWNKPAIGCTTPEYGFGDKPDARRPKRVNASRYFADLRARERDIGMHQALAGKAANDLLPQAA